MRMSISPTEAQAAKPLDSRRPSSRRVWDLIKLMRPTRDVGATAAPEHLLLGRLQHLQSTVHPIMPWELAHGRILPADADIGFAQYPHRRFDQSMARGFEVDLVLFLDGRMAFSIQRGSQSMLSPQPYGAGRVDESYHSRQARSPETKS